MQGIRFAKFKGISLEIHQTFIWLILIIVILLLIFSPAEFFSYLLLLAFLFVSVFIHELFHSLVSIWRGFKVKKIILLPIGGLSVSTDFPEKPLEELLISLAGPLFNFIIVFAIIVIINVFPGLPWPSLSGGEALQELNTAILGNPLFALFWVNLILGAFNLFVPALPLDGGRVLRALLALNLDLIKLRELQLK